MKQVFATSLLIIILLFAGTTVAIFYARGYRIFPENGKTRVAGTGLLVATSKPDGAKVFIDGKLNTATNNTINLAPKTYHVKITKDGYFSWEKQIIVEKEIVSRADAVLFPTSPRLEPLTATGANNPTLDASGTLVAYTVASASAGKNGVYILDMNGRNILNITRLIRQITDETFDTFSLSSLEFSPDGSQLLASISSGLRPRWYLLSNSGFNQSSKLLSPLGLDQTKALWQQEKEKAQKELLSTLDKPLRIIVETYFQNPIISPEKNKIIYTASESAKLPIVKTPRLIGSNSTPEQRSIEAENTYIYDIKEDKNYIIFEKDKKPNKYLWHPDSNHILFIQDRKIKIVEFDAQNTTTLYSGPFVDEFIFPWPDGSDVILLTNLNNPEVPPNLYRLSLN